ncbi:S8 family serine peptidase [Streptomyces sp. NPDC051940]|uniref:S8 family serine peptidase n=1 Tax=Streptomyces sp. NPDC051940 TaxID=3155675 RepID=UPI00342A197A
MRPIPRAASTLAIAVVLAATAVVPASGDPAAAAGDRSPLTGSATAGAGTATQVTLITGDMVDVATDAEGRTSMHMRPGEDGTPVDHVTEEHDGDRYVIPVSAFAGIREGWLDKELFNVTGLVEQGYDDARTEALPLIAQYATRADVPKAGGDSALPGRAHLVRALPVVRGAAVKVDKKQAAATWKDLAAHDARKADRITKVWLDAKVKGAMAESNAQIGSPTAWASGITGTGVKVAVLDTGVDAAHPDFAGQIADAKDFTGSAYGTEDRRGHGTHTASTVAGTGAASENGKERGVAPGARLLIGKVLGDGGSGSESMIISGMQWAVDSGADVVSMSLGTSTPSDCSDPMSQAAQALAAQNKALFVISAGNLGRAESITSPGCAPAALTVGAVDSEDGTAAFSSRGTVMGAHTVKPEIAAPGVNVLAANVGGRGVYAYQRMSGTSMAAPHVAGAAALLKQKHPGWDAARLKNALVSAAKSDIPGDVQETGAGRLDVPRSLKQTVLGPGAVSAGASAWPQTGADIRTLPVTYTNTTDAPVTLTLRMDPVLGNDGTRTATGIARLGTDTLTVPAGGTAEVPLTIEPTVGIQPAQYGDFGGRIQARVSDGTTVTVPFGFYLEPETVDVTVKLIGLDGRPQTSPAAVLDVIGMDDITGGRYYPATGEQKLRLRAGTYYVNAVVPTRNAAGAVDTASELALPEVKLTKDTELVLDARKAREVTYETDRPAETASATVSYGRWWDDADGTTWVHAGSVLYGGVKHVRTWGQGEAHRGGFEAASWFRAVQPGAGSSSPYVYNLGVFDRDVIVPGRTLKTTDANLAAVDAQWYSLGAQGDFLDTIDNYRPWNPSSGTGGSLFQPVRVPFARTQYFSAGGDTGAWGETGTSWRMGELMRGPVRSFEGGERLKETWYKGIMRPTAPINRNGTALLSGERQGDRIGIQTSLFTDAGGHFMYAQGFGDVGNLTLYKNGEKLYDHAWPYGVFPVTPEPADYVLQQFVIRAFSQRQFKYPYGVITRFRFRSAEDPTAYSQTLPLVFPGYDVPVDTGNTVGAGKVRIRLSATGHGDYTPGEITKASVKFSYDGPVAEPVWTDAAVVREDGAWYAEIDHAGASGKSVSLLVDLTTADGGSVEQRVINGYGVR